MVQTAFERMLGREPDTQEQVWLQAVADSLCIRSDDPVWGLVLLMYAHQQTQREHFGRLLEEKLDEVEARLARRLSALPRSRSAAARVTPTAVAVTAAAVCLLGGVCVAAGAVLQSRGHPLWVEASPSLWRDAVASVLAAPVGWTLPLALALPALDRAFWGWHRALSEQHSRKQRIQGAAALLGVLAGVVAWGALLHSAL